MDDDDGGDWFTNDDDEAPAEAAAPAPAAAPTAAAAASTPASAVAADAPAPEPVEEPMPEEELEFLDPDRLLLCKHWIRPRFLQYKYLFDYRHNYYDDVIDFLDKRQRGLLREIPRPQTWAERALRTYSSKSHRTDFFKSIDEDKKLAAKMKLTGAFYHYHTREYFNRKYSSIL